MKPINEIWSNGIEDALVFMAYLVVRYGPVYYPYIERLEKELETARQEDAKVEHAKRILERYTIDGDWRNRRGGVGHRAPLSACVSSVLNGD